MDGDFTIEQAFQITGRGVAVIGFGDLSKLAFGIPWIVQVMGSPGSRVETRASRELMVVNRSEGEERDALLLRDVHLDQVPVGALIRLLRPAA